MKSDVIKVTNTGKGTDDALEAAYASAVYRGLGKKETLHLRLLAEETLGMARQLTGKAKSEFWVESEGTAFEIHFVAHPLVTGSMRKELLKVSTSGQNEAAKGFMGKLRDIFDRALSPEDAGGLSDYYSLGLLVPGEYYASDPTMMSVSADAVTWSMQKYKAAVEDAVSKGKKSKETWDELEKSIVVNIADEVKISIEGDEVEMTVYKKF